MQVPFAITVASLLVPLAIIITYYDVRYRRIPNAFVLATLLGGLVINAFYGGPRGLATSLGGLLLAFGMMFLLHLFGAMGAGDVKLFGAIGAVLGAHLVPSTFVVVLLTGGVLALYTMLRSRIFAETLWKVLHLFAGVLPGSKMPRFAVPADRRHTIPYGVAITFGSLISLFVFRA